VTSIVIVELKGFSAMATILAKDVDVIGVTPERVRASIIETVNRIVDESMTGLMLGKRALLGGDTWGFTFQDVEEAVLFGSRALKTIQRMSTEKGFFYIKPSVAITVGDPKFQDDKFLDDDSIKAYRFADRGRPFNFYVTEEAIDLVNRINGVSVSVAEIGSDHGSPVYAIDWRHIIDPIGDEIGNFEVSLPALYSITRSFTLTQPNKRCPR
jgi:hypothetical protein